MSKSYDDYVNVLNDDEFDSLIESINKRIDKKKYGETNFEDLAIKYGRKPVCPKCGKAMPLGSRFCSNCGYENPCASEERKEL